MTAMTTTLTTNGTFPLPTDLIGPTVVCSVQGATGAGGPGAGIVDVEIPIILFPLEVFVGQLQSGGVGGSGYSGGGSGGTTAGGGNGGGGSSAVTSNTNLALSTGTLLVEAGGSDGANQSGGFVQHGGGGGGGFSGNPGGAGVNGGYSGGGGGSQGGFGGGTPGLGLAAPVGAGSQTLVFGGPGLLAPALETVPGGSGGPSGGIILGAGVASSFATSTVIFLTFGQGSAATSGQVVFSWDQADAPDAPTLVSPTSGWFDTEFGDVALASPPLGAIFTGTYNTPGADTGALLGVALSVIGGPINGYYNGTDFSSSTPVWLLPTTGGGAANGQNFTIGIPPGVLPDGVTYTWTMATQESFAGVEGSFASTQTFASALAPTAVITSPIGEVNTVTPTVSWTPTIAAGSSAFYRFVVYDSPTNSPGDGSIPPIVDTGVQASGGTSFTLGGGCNSGTTYYGYLLIASTGPNTALQWVETIFRPIVGGGFTAPVLAVTLGVDPATGMPGANLALTYPGAGAVTAIEAEATYGTVTDADILANWATLTTTAASGFDLSSPFNTAISYRARTVYTVGGDLHYSPWSNTVAYAGTPSIYWWVVPPNNLSMCMQLFRLASSSSSSSGNDTTFSPTTPAMPGNLISSLTVDELEQLGSFRPFGKSNAVLVHGDIWSGEFDLSVYFETSAAWTNFRAIRDLQNLVLLKSDMEGDVYWVTIGGDLAPGIASRAGRQQNPTRGLTVHCTPTDPPLPQ